MNTAVSRSAKFKNWRVKRPFWGGTFAILSGLIILWVPLKLYEVAAAPGSILFVGFFLGGLVLLFGILSFFMQKLSTLFGILMIFASVLSIMGALGGFLIGTVLGIIGGALCVSWKPELAFNQEKQDTSAEYHADHEIASSKEN